jgi:polar amino acid transport system substrate-binding protein
MTWNRAATLFVLLALSINPAAANEREVHVVTLTDYPPFGFHADDANRRTTYVVPPGEDAEGFQGYSWDVLRESFHSQGYTVRLRIVPWARAMHELQYDDIHLLYPAGRTPEREAYMTYSDEPVNEVDFRIYARTNSDLPERWNGLRSLSGLRIGVARGWNFGSEWDETDAFEKQNLDGIEQGFAMLDQQRIDGFAGYEVVWDYQISELGLDGNYVKLPPFDTAREYVTAYTGHAAGEEMVEIFERGRRQIEENGTLDRINASW